MRNRFRWDDPDEKEPVDYADVLTTVSINEDVDPPDRVVVQGYYVNGSFYDATFNTELNDVVAWMYAPEAYGD